MVWVRVLVLVLVWLDNSPFLFVVIWMIKNIYGLIQLSIFTC
jgi:hypothetical protein